LVGEALREAGEYEPDVTEPAAGEAPGEYEGEVGE
jgi:hypothetical protein